LHRDPGVGFSAAGFRFVLYSSVCTMKFRLPVILLSVMFALANGRAQTSVRPVTIVLPPHLLANTPATLAILGPDGHLAVGVEVAIGDGQHVTTDATGRAMFIAPPDGAFIASASGVSAAALVDAAPMQASAVAGSATVAPEVSQHDRFTICGSGFSGNVASDAVTINGDRAFVLAASPVCIVALPQPRTLAGPARIEIDAPGTRATASTSLIALDFVPPNPPLLPGRKGKLFVRAEGTTSALDLIVENHSPGVVHFLRGETQRVRTSGGAANQVAIQVQAIRSGDFSFQARIVPPANPAAALRYLEIAEGVAPRSMQGELKTIASDLAKHPRNAEKVQPVLARLVGTLPAGSLRILIEAAGDAL
jgi:hypothetical protein